MTPGFVSDVVGSERIFMSSGEVAIKERPNKLFIRMFQFLMGAILSPIAITGAVRWFPFEQFWIPFVGVAVLAIVGLVAGRSFRMFMVGLLVGAVGEAIALVWIATRFSRGLGGL